MSLDHFKGRAWAFRKLLSDSMLEQKHTEDSPRVVRMKTRMDAERAGWNVPALDPDAHLGAQGGE